MTTREDALRLLRVLDVHQVRGREGAVVVPREWAFCAHLHAGTERYEAALRHLGEEGALARAGRFGAIIGGQPGPREIVGTGCREDTRSRHLGEGVGAPR